MSSFVVVVVLLFIICSTRSVNVRVCSACARNIFSDENVLSAAMGFDERQRDAERNK